jgi:hypothetical protein
LTDDEMLMVAGDPRIIEVQKARAAALGLKPEPKEPPMLLCERVTEPLILPDNAIDQCSKCFKLVQLRPHAPKIARICRPCAAPTLADAKMFTTKPMWDDFLSYVKKNSN